MPTHITYAGTTYVDHEYSVEDTIDRVRSALAGGGSGILVVTTKRGPVNLLISASIPLVIEHKEPTGPKQIHVL